MATTVQLRRGTTNEHSSFIGAVAEVTVDTDKNVPVVHDGVTQGGFPVALETNLDTLNSDFSNHANNVSNPHNVTKGQVGLGNVLNSEQVPKAGGTFTGHVSFSGANLTFEGSTSVVLQDSGNNTVGSFKGDSTKGTIVAGSGTANKITFVTNGSDRMTIDDSGVVRVGGNLVWHSGNDGVGSGLNADSLQGKDSNYFATQNAFDSHVNDFNSHKNNTSNPHQVTADQVGITLTVDGTQKASWEWQYDTTNDELNLVY